MIHTNYLFHCPNCGAGVFGAITMHNVGHLMCSEKCGEEWKHKYAEMMLGRTAMLMRQKEKTACNRS